MIAKSKRKLNKIGKKKMSGPREKQVAKGHNHALNT